MSVLCSTWKKYIYSLCLESREQECAEVQETWLQRITLRRKTVQSVKDWGHSLFMNKDCYNKWNNLFLVSTGNNKTKKNPSQAFKDRFDKYLVGTVWT